MEVQACYLLHKKILKISESGSSAFSVGKLINFMSNDAKRYEFFARCVPFAIMTPFAITVGIWQIYIRVGNAAFVTLGTLIFLTMARVDQIQWGSCSRWPSSVWCDIRTSRKMTIEMTHSTLDFLFIWLLVFVSSSVTSICGYFIGKIRRKTSGLTDKRIKTLEETVNSIFIIKLYCWEKFALRKIMKSRHWFKLKSGKMITPSWICI